MSIGKARSRFLLLGQARGIFGRRETPPETDGGRP